MTKFFKVAFIFAAIAHVGFAVAYATGVGEPTLSTSIGDQILIAALFGTLYMDVKREERRK